MLRSNDQTARISLQISRNVKQQRTRTTRRRQSHLASSSHSVQNFQTTPSPRQRPHLDPQRPTVKTQPDNSRRSLPEPPGSTSTAGFPVPNSVTRRSVKRDVGGDEEEGKRKKPAKPQLRCKPRKENGFSPRFPQGKAGGARPQAGPTRARFQPAPRICHGITTPPGQNRCRTRPESHC